MRERRLPGVEGGGEKAVTLTRFERIQDESSHCVLGRKVPEQLMLSSD